MPGSEKRVVGLLRRLTIERAAIVIVFLLLFAMASRVAVDPDMWWHLRVGQGILETGDFVYTDTYSHTFAGAIHKNHSAFGQIVMAVLWALGGHLGMTLMVSVLAVSGMAFLYSAGSGSIYMQGFVLVFGAACAAVFWSPRPQMFSFLFGAAVIYLLFDLKRKGRDRLWLLAPLFWLWGNTHGGYVIGYLFIAAIVVGESLNNRFGKGDARVPTNKIRKLMALTLLSAALLPINPLGLDVFAVPINTIGIDGLRSLIQEWKPPDFSQPSTWGFLILLLLLVVALVASRRKFDFSEWLLVGGTLFMALLSGRHLPLFALAAVPVTTIHFDEILRRLRWTIPRRTWESPRRVILNLSLVVAVALGTLAQIRAVTDADTTDAQLNLNFPVNAVAHLKASNLKGNLFNSYNWGGYLIYSAPAYPVFIDGRTDLYGDFLLDYHDTALGLAAWRDVFEGRDIGIALIETESGLAAQLAEDAAWRLEFRDQLASIYVRADLDHQG